MNKSRSRIPRRFLAFVTALAMLIVPQTLLWTQGSSAQLPAPKLVIYQDFENYSNTHESGFVSILMPSTDKNEVISGNASGIVDMVGTALDYQNGMWQIGYRLEANTEYTLNFKYKVISATSGTRFYMLARSDNTGFADDRYIFFDNSSTPADRSESGDWYNFNIIDKGAYRHIRFSFKNNEQTDRYLMWGVNGTGRIAIDDVSLYTGHAGIEQGLIQPIAQNSEKPYITQDFEDNISNMNLSTNGQAEPIHSGRINGSASLAGKAGPDWTFAETISSQVPIISWDIHTVTFKMKKQGDLAPGEFYHFTASSPTGRNAVGFSSDRYFRWDNEGTIFEANTGSLASLSQLRCYVAGVDDYWFVKLTFYVDGYSDYVLQWGINTQNTNNRMIIDDIRVFYGKDYTHDLPVNLTTPQPLYNYTFEDGYPVGLQTANGQLTNRNPNIINGSVSYQAQTLSGSQWQMVLKTDPTHAPLAPNSYYTITMRLKSLAQTTGYYQFATCTDSHAQDSVIRMGSLGQDAGSFNLPQGFITRNEDGILYLSATFKTGSEANQRFEINIYDGGSLIIDDLCIYAGRVAGQPSEIEVIEKQAVPVLSERFETQDTALWNFNPLGGAIGFEASEVINGSYSYAAKHIGGEYYISLESKPTSFQFKPNTQYHVLFRYRTLGSVSSNGQFMIAAKTEIGGPLSDQFVRFNPDGTPVEGVGNNASISAVANQGYYDARFSFTTKDFSDYRIIFASINAGDWALDDILIFEGPFFAEDTLPSVILQDIRPIYTENFENADIYSSAFHWKNSGLTWKSGEIVNGSYSYRLTATPDQYGYSIPMESDLSKTTFQPGKSYTVQLRWKPLSGTQTDYVIFAFRSSSGDQYLKLWGDGTKIEGNDRSYHVVNQNGIYQLKVTFTLSGAGPYQFAAVFQNNPEIIVDDLEIYEGFLTKPLSSVSVVVPNITSVFREGFENNRAVGDIKLFPEAGSYLYNNDKVISGSFSYQTFGRADGEYTKALSSRALNLSPSSTYTVFFRYKNAEFTSQDGFFQIALNTPAGGYLNDVYIRLNARGEIVEGNHKSVKVSQMGDIYSVAVTFQLKNFADYQLSMHLYGKGSVAVDDFEIYTGTIYNPQDSGQGQPPVPELIVDESFDGQSSLFQLKSGAYGIRDSALINGTASLQVRANPDAYGYTIAASSDRTLFKPEGLGIYTVSLRYRFVEETDANGFAMVALRTNQGGPINDRFIKFTPGSTMIESNALGFRAEKDSNEIRMEVTFALENYSDYRLEFVLFGNQGILSVDDVRVFRGVAAYAMNTSTPTPKTENQINASKIFDENFEHNGEIGSRFHLRQGVVVFEEGQILNGSFSIAMKAQATGQWMDGFVSNLDTLALEPGKTYSLIFRFKTLEAAGDDGFIQVAARIPGGDGLSDSFVRFKPDGSYVDGNAAYDLVHRSDNYMIGVFAFTTGQQPAELVFSAYSSGGIIVDDLSMYENTAYLFNTEAPVVTLPTREVGAEDYPMHQGEGLYRIPNDKVPPYKAPANDSVDFDGWEIAQDPYEWQEEVITKETITREEPYEEIITKDAVIQKIVRRFVPKKSGFNTVLIILISVLAVAGIGIGTFLIIRSRRKKKAAK